MSEKIKTVEIAGAIGTALNTLVGTLSPAPTVRWEPNRARTGLTDDSVTRPNVLIRVHPVYNAGFAQSTKLREYDVTIEVQTDYADDPGQLNLAEIEQAVGEWVVSSPQLSLTSGTFRHLTLPAAPRRDETLDRVQVVTWECQVGLMF